MNTKHNFILSLIIGALIPPGSVNALATPEEGIEVSFIDVGQGDSALISDASGFDMLIDGGKSSASCAHLTVAFRVSLTELLFVGYRDIEPLFGVRCI